MNAMTAVQKAEIPWDEWSREFIEKTLPMFDETILETISRKLMIDRGKNKTLNELKPIENTNKNRWSIQEKHVQK